MNARDDLIELLADYPNSITHEGAEQFIDAYRAEVLDEQGPRERETIGEAAQMYRSLRTVIERTMTDPGRWDGDGSEDFHFGRYVQWLAAERATLRAEELHEAAEDLRSTDGPDDPGHSNTWDDGVDWAADRLDHRADASGTTDTPDAELTIYRASHDSIVMGLYTTATAAREHCETALRREMPDVNLDWIEDEEDGVAELTAWVGGEECVTGYVVTPLTVASAYDEEADE